MLENSLVKNIQELKDKAKDLSVLYVEDEEFLRNKTYNFFNKIFSNVDIAVDGKDGLEKYNKKKYDIIVTDILMPNMDGFMLIKNILNKNDKQEIIISSAYTEKGFRDKALELGVKKYIHKPMELNELIEVLSSSIDNIK
jgi:YesN/AraC family two-component response regulator